MLGCPLRLTEEITEDKTVIQKTPPDVLTGQKSVKPIALLVDDDPFVYMLLRRHTEDQIELESTMKGEFAIKLCDQKQYALIFMDINLGRGIDGKQTTRVIRKINGYDTIPIIATTAYAMARRQGKIPGCGLFPLFIKTIRQA